jgi:site-specific recombinase XerD
VNPANEASWREWERDMKGRALSPWTLEKNRRALEQLEAAAGGRDLLTLAKADIQDWVAAMAAARLPSGVMTRFSSARAFYNWAEAEELIKRSPMYRLKAPANPPPLIIMPPVDDVRAILRACAGKDFEARRDTSLIRIMCEPGAPRASEAANLALAHVDLTRDDLKVIRGKGGKSRIMPLGAVTATSVSRYLRARARHPKAVLPQLFVGNGGRGRMTRSGVGGVLERRCDQAGVPRIHPHQLRHLAAHRFFLAGGREGDAMRLFGWDDPAMPRLYAAAAAVTRAVDAARVMALGDEL